MNKAYRLIWNEITRNWVAVSEIAKARGKRASGAVLLAASGLAFAGPPASDALPTGGSILGGAASGSIATSGATMTVTQNVQRMIANWTAFDIGANASVRFVQPSASAIALNRVLSQDPTQILGRLSANGQLMLVNPAGVVFGRGSQVDVGALVTSTLGISDENFLAANYRFANAGAAGGIESQGRIVTPAGGVVAFLAPVVKNDGSIETPQGSTLLAAADIVSIDFNGDGLITYSLEAGAANALVENSGSIMADGGVAVLTTKAADAVSLAVVNNTGVVRARTLDAREGRILLLSDMDNGEVRVGGTLDGSAPDGGDGGFIETSGHVVTMDAAHVDAGAAAGMGGTWLIDPQDLTIDATGAGNIQAALDTGTSVTATTTACSAAYGVCSGSAGNLTLSGSIAKTAGGAASLTLIADGYLLVGAGVTISDTAGGALSLNLQATGPIRVADNAVATNSIDIHGALYMGGNTGGATYATGNSTYVDGIYIGAKSALAAAGMVLWGQGATAATGMAGGAGIKLAAGASFTTATSAIGMTGIGGTGGTGSAGSNGGVNGQGAGTAGGAGGTGGAGGAGIDLSDTAEITGASVALSGTGGAGGTGGSGGTGGTATSSSSYQGGTGGTGGAGGAGGAGIAIGAATVSATAGTLTNLATGGAGGSGGTGGNAGHTSNNTNLGSAANGNTGGSGGTGGTGGAGVVLGASQLTATSGIDQTGAGGTGGRGGNGGRGGDGGDTNAGFTSGGNGGKGGNAGKGGDSGSGLILGDGATVAADSGTIVLENAGAAVGSAGSAGGGGSRGCATGLGGGCASNGASGNANTSGTKAAAFVAAGAGYIGAANAGSSSADIRFINDSLSLGALAIRSAGALSIETLTAATLIDLGTYAVDSNHLQLDQSAFWNGTDGNFKDGFSAITIGSAGQTGTISINGLAYSDGLTVEAGGAGGSIAVSGTVTDGSGSLAGALTLNAADAIVLGTGSITTHNQAVTIEGESFSQGDLDVIAGSGAITITADTVALGANTGNNPFWTTGDLTLRPLAAGTAMSLAGASAFDLNTAEIAYLKGSGASRITVGRTDSTAALSLGGAVTLADSDVVLVARDIVLGAGASLDAGIGTATLAAVGGDFRNNSGSATPITAGQWWIYSSDPSQNTLNGMAVENKHYHQAYTGSTPAYAGSGNWFLYSIAPTLSVAADATTVTYGAAIGAVGASYTGFIDGDTAATAGIGGSAAYVVGGAISTAGHHTAGTHDLAYLSGLASSLGYAFADDTASVGELTVTQRTLTVGAAGQDKVYDATTDASVTLNDDRVSGDALSFSHAAASFDDKNAGLGKTVTVSGIGLAGADAGNYVLASATAGTTAAITPKALAISGIAAADKVYDGTTRADFTGVGSVAGLAGDDVVLSGTGVGAFADKNVGAGKAITVSGYTLGGSDAGNYTLSGTTAAASITPRLLRISYTGQNKLYDGTTAATVTTSDNRVSGDLIDIDYSASFGIAGVGFGMPVSITGVSLSGTDAANYALAATTGSTSADIRKATLTLTVDDQSRPYLSQNPVFTYSVSGFVDGEDADSIGFVPYFGGQPFGALPGEYSIDWGFIVPQNYQVVVVPGTLTVTADAASLYSYLPPPLPPAPGGFGPRPLMNVDSGAALSPPPLFEVPGATAPSAPKGQLSTNEAGAGGSDTNNNTISGTLGNQGNDKLVGNAGGFNYLAGTGVSTGGENDGADKFASGGADVLVADSGQGGNGKQAGAGGSDANSNTVSGTLGNQGNDKDVGNAGGSRSTGGGGSASGATSGTGDGGNGKQAGAGGSDTNGNTVSGTSGNQGNDKDVGNAGGSRSTGGGGSASGATSGTGDGGNGKQVGAGGSDTNGNTVSGTQGNQGNDKDVGNAGGEKAGRGGEDGGRSGSGEGGAAGGEAEPASQSGPGGSDTNENTVSGTSGNQGNDKDVGNAGGEKSNGAEDGDRSASTETAGEAGDQTTGDQGANDAPAKGQAGAPAGGDGAGGHGDTAGGDPETREGAAQGGGAKAEGDGKQPSKPADGQADADATDAASASGSAGDADGADTAPAAPEGATEGPATEGPATEGPATEGPATEGSATERATVGEAAATDGEPPAAEGGNGGSGPNAGAEVARDSGLLDLGGELGQRAAQFVTTGDTTTLTFTAPGGAGSTGDEPGLSGGASDTATQSTAILLFTQNGDTMAPGGALVVVEQGQSLKASSASAEVSTVPTLEPATMRFVSVDYRLPTGAQSPVTVGVSPDGVLVVKVSEATKAVMDDRSIALLGLAIARDRLGVKPGNVKGVVIQLDGAAGSDGRGLSLALGGGERIVDISVDGMAIDARGGSVAIALQGRAGGGDAETTGVTSVAMPVVKLGANDELDLQPGVIATEAAGNISFEHAEGEPARSIGVPGPMRQSVGFSIDERGGRAAPFTVAVADQGTVIRPQSELGRQLLEAQRDLVIGVAVSEVRLKLGVPLAGVGTIYLDMPAGN